MKFKELHRWSVRSFFDVGWRWPEDTIRPLADAFNRRVEVVDRRKHDFDSLHLVTLHFDGKIEPRDLRGNTGFRGRLFFAYPGDVIYSKIDARNGAIGVVSDEIGTVAVSSEYPVYRIKPEVALSQYIKLLFRTSFFRDTINSMISGASGRKRVQPSQLEEIEVPLPSLEIQRAIVARYRTAEQGVEKARDSLSRIAAELDNLLWREYHRQGAFDVIRRRYLAVNWSHAEAWDMKSARAAAYRLACPGFVPMSSFAEEATEIVRPSDDPEKEWPVYGVNNTEGVFLNCYQKGKAFNAPYKRIQRDWFFHNPTRANVGSIGIVPEVPEDAITSPEYQVWRLRDDTPPGYVAVLVNTPFFLELVQFHRVGAVKQRLYVDNLLNIRVPPIPRQMQNKIAKTRARALLEVEKASQYAKETRTEIEEMILGVRPVK